MTIARLAVEYVAERSRSGSYRAESARKARHVLDSLADHVGRGRDPGSVTPAEIDGWLAAAPHLAARSVHLRVTMVRSFYRWLARRGLVERDPTFGYVLPRVPRRVPRVLADDAVGKLLANADVREAVIVSLMVMEGLRRGEVARLRREDVDRDRLVMIVRGKGDHERPVPLTGATLCALAEYEAACPPVGPFVVRSVSMPAEGLSPARVGDIVTALMMRCGVKQLPRDGRTGHALRHTAATRVLEAANFDLRVVQEFLGHADLGTTQVYLGLAGADRIRSAVDGRRYR